MNYTTGRSYKDYLLIILQLLVHIAITDLAKAFDKVVINKLWSVLVVRKIVPHLPQSKDENNITYAKQGGQLPKPLLLPTYSNKAGVS